MQAFTTTRRPERTAGHRPGAADAVASRAAQPPGWVLVVEADGAHGHALAQILGEDGHRVQTVDETHGLTQRLVRAPIDVVIIDLQGSAERTGVEWIERVKMQQPDVEIVALAPREMTDAAARCCEELALFDCLEVPVVDRHRVRGCIRRAIERRRLLLRARQLERQFAAVEGAEAPAAAPAPAPPADEPVASAEAASLDQRLPLDLAAYERAAVVRAMREADFDATRASRLLGIGRSTFYRKLARHGVAPNSGEICVDAADSIE